MSTDLHPIFIFFKVSCVGLPLFNVTSFSTPSPSTTASIQRCLFTGKRLIQINTWRQPVCPSVGRSAALWLSLSLTLSFLDAVYLVKAPVNKSLFLIWFLNALFCLSSFLKENWLWILYFMPCLSQPVCNHSTVLWTQVLFFFVVLFRDPFTSRHRGAVTAVGCVQGRVQLLL